MVNLKADQLGDHEEDERMALKMAVKRKRVYVLALDSPSSD
jgi:hypothetical protein